MQFLRTAPIICIFLKIRYKLFFEVINVIEKEIKSNSEAKETKKNINQNQEHNVKKEALGPNTRR